MQEIDILNKLFAASETSNIPTRKATSKRIGLSFWLKGLKEGEVEKLRKQFTRVKVVRGVEEKSIDQGGFNRALIAIATTSIGEENSGVRWNHAELLSKYQASSDEQVIKRVLLSGEISQFADAVLELSGYYEDLGGEVKNSSEAEDLDS